MFHSLFEFKTLYSTEILKHDNLRNLEEEKNVLKRLADVPVPDSEPSDEAAQNSGTN